MTELFKDTDYIKALYEDYYGEYEDILIKEEYELYPDIRYPNITIDEIENSNATQYKDESGEFASNLGYQITISCDQSATNTAQQNVRRIANIINTYIQDKNGKYYTLDRVGGLGIAPHPIDNNIKVGYLRYRCVIRHDNNTIYRRY